MIFLCNVEKVKLKCSQEGKIFTAKISSLSREDMQPLTIADFQKGSALLCDIQGKAYPAQFMAFDGIMHVVAVKYELYQSYLKLVKMHHQNSQNSQKGSRLVVSYQMIMM